MIKNFIALSLFVLLSFSMLFSQFYDYTDDVYKENIRSVQCYRGNDERNLPFLYLKENNKITVEFDELRATPQAYYYSIQHCNYDWQPSRLMVSDYWDDLSYFQITDFRSSQSTLIPFIHYTFEVPNKFKVSGNYLIKVYKDLDENDVILTRRILIVEDPLKIKLGDGQAISENVADRFAMQTLFFNLIPNQQFPIQNPRRDIKVRVIQNGRWETSKELEPLYILNDRIEYSFSAGNDFEGGNEFRRCDIRSYRYRSETISKYEIQDKMVIAYQVEDKPRSSNVYLREFDMNGAFFIINREFPIYDIESDYIKTVFTLKVTQPYKYDVYVLGRFNDWKFRKECKMKYDPTFKVYTAEIWLKQGVYDYCYALNKKGEIDERSIEGSFFETENNYMILVYYRSPTDWTDRIIGFKKLGVNE